MLSAAKVKIHGMQDDRWVIKDKIAQYRGLIELYERDREIQTTDLMKQKKRFSKDIRQLRKDIFDKRDELTTVVFGDKQFIRNALQDHRKLQLAYMNTKADKVLECIHQENFNKRKLLDKIKYTKNKKMERFRNLQLESAEIKDRLQFEGKAKLPAEIKEQTVSNYVQCANVKKNAALAIKGMYQKILDILKKDSSYFTSVLEALKADCIAQGKCLIGATEMGQLAMEYLDDRKFEFVQLENEIKKNMKERERTLRLIRRQVQELIESFPNLLRKDDLVNLDDLYEDADATSIRSIHSELDEVMDTCKRLQRATLVSNFDQILPRLKDQDYQSTRLMNQLKVNSCHREGLIDDLNHAMLMLASLKNVGQQETSSYLKEKEDLLKKIAAEKTKQKTLMEELNKRGTLIIDLKTSLQQIVQILSNVGLPVQMQKVTLFEPEEGIMQPIPYVEGQMEKLINEIRSKLNLLMGAVTKMDVTKDTKTAAAELYHKILTAFMKDRFKEEPEDEEGLIEFEMEDPLVPSYKAVKKMSKKIVESQVSEFDVPDAPGPKKK